MFDLILGGSVVGVNGGRGHTPLVPLHLLIQLQSADNPINTTPKIIKNICEINQCCGSRSAEFGSGSRLTGDSRSGPGVKTRLFLPNTCTKLFSQKHGFIFLLPSCKASSKLQKKIQLFNL
jgi:hypothetical protein